MRQEEPNYLCPTDNAPLVKIKSKRKLVCVECGQQFYKKQARGEILI